MKFTVRGNAVPYQRITQGQVRLMRIPDWKLAPTNLKVKERLRRYFEWKDFVLAHAPRFDRKPKAKVYLHVMVYFRNKAHADPENIRKGIQDALFLDDKYVAGSYDFDYDVKDPRCEIQITTEGGLF